LKGHIEVFPLLNFLLFENCSEAVLGATMIRKPKRKQMQTGAVLQTLQYVLYDVRTWYQVRTMGLQLGILQHLPMDRDDSLSSLLAIPYTICGTVDAVLSFPLRHYNAQKQ
jgi:hypothetical protein